MKEGGEESEIGKYQGRTRKEQGKEKGGAREVKVSAGSSGEDRSIGKGEGHGWELGRAHELYKRGSRRRTWVAPESARMGEGVTEHNRGMW